MNERIKQLADEAEKYADYYAMLSETGEKEIFIKKFAELIVQECIWLFGETRTEPSLERFILTRLGIDHE
jgi:hypothetical protein